MKTMTAQCSVAGCDRPTRTGTASLCNAHYFRVWRNGTPGSATITERRDGCSIEGCAKPHDSRGYCEMHYARWKRHGDPTYRGAPEPRYGPDNSSWRGDDVTYGPMHERLRRYRGSADDQRCAHCDNAAHQWAYDHADEDERSSDYGPYSVKLEHYFPLCVSCHKTFDLQRIAAGKVATNGHAGFFKTSGTTDTKDTVGTSLPKRPENLGGS